MSITMQGATRRKFLMTTQAEQPFKPGPIALACALLGASAAGAAESSSTGALLEAGGALPFVQAQGAPTQQSGGMLSVVIAAQRQPQAVQKKAESIETVSGTQLEQNAVPDITSLIQSVAGVSLKTEGTGQTEIEMRGMTSSGGSSPTTGFYLDDIPLSPPAGAQNGKVVISPALYDMDGVDVLRGPQGTAYGAGAMGGAVKLSTTPADPAAFAASVQSILSGTRGGGFNHTDNAMLNTPLIEDELALRIVVSEAYTSGWIERIVAGPYPVAGNNGATRGDVAAAPVLASHPRSNAAQQYNLRMSLLWKATPELTIAPAVYHFTSRQDGISAFDSTSGTPTHYQPFDIAEPMTDRMTIGALAVTYAFDSVDLSWNSAWWTRRSTQVQDGSEDFNNPQSGATLASNNNLNGPQPGYYGPGGTGSVVGTEDDPTRQLSSEIRLASRGGGPLQWVAGAFASDYWSTWNFSGITANPSVYMDLGTNQAATTDQWFVAHSPTHMKQFALFGNASYALDSHWKVEAGARFYRYDYAFSSTISGWGSGLGAATPSATGEIRQVDVGVNPRLALSYNFDKDDMLYTNLARGSRPGGGNALYPTTGAFWSAAYAPFNYSNGWPSSYKPDSVRTLEMGGKARFFDRKLTLNASAYYEDWRHPQLMAYPGDWAFNISGDKAAIKGADVDMKAILGGGLVFSAAVGYTHETVSPGSHWEILPANIMPDVPLFNGNLSLTYSKPLSDGYTLTAEVDNAYVGARYSLSFLYPYQSTASYAKLPSYDLTNLRIGLESSHGWSVNAFVTNLTNRHAALENMFQETEPSAAFSRVMSNQPFTMGINLSYKM